MRPGVPAMWLSQLLEESRQDASAAVRAQRFQGDRDYIPADVEVSRGLRDFLNQLAPLLVSVAVMGMKTQGNRDSDPIGLIRHFLP